MSYKFDSLIMILNKLDSRKHVTVQSLMDELEVSERTIYRYIQTLQVAGFPIEYKKGKNSYMFSEDYSLRRPDLTVEETLAFALAKKLLGNFGSGMEQSLNMIEEKIATKKTSLPKHIVLSAEALPPIIAKHLGTIHQAISNYQKIMVEYDPLHSKDKTIRKVDPYYLFFRDGFWYLRGFCNKVSELRTFALDRMVSLTVLNEHFLPKGVMPENELSASFGTWIEGEGEPTEVVLVFDEEIKSQAMRKKWHESQKEKELEDGRLEMRFKIRGIGGIKKWIYQWIPNVEIVSPKELSDDFLKSLNKACHRNRK